MVAKPKPVKAAERAKGGHPTDFRPEYVQQAIRLCSLGATDADMADFFGVTIKTLNNWKMRYPQFLQSMSVAKEEADKRVERSLYQRAVGYTFESVKIFMPANAEKPVYAPYREHVPPDVGAASLWLRNRQPDRWRDRQEHHYSGTVNHLNMTAEELLAQIQSEAAALGMRVMLPSPKKRGGVQIEAEAEEEE